MCLSVCLPIDIRLNNSEENCGIHLYFCIKISVITVNSTHENDLLPTVVELVAFIEKI